jgi:ABC-type glycerol-3-phosphate transport system permease component
MKVFKRLVNFLALLILSLLCLFPFFYLWIGATHDNSWIFSSRINLKFGISFFTNLASIGARYPFFQIFLNSLLSATIVTIVSIVLIVMFIFSTLFIYKRMSRWLDAWFVVFMFLPTTAHFIGSIYTISALQLRDQFFALVIPFLINLRVYFYLKEELKILSSEIIEAMVMDGASAFQVLHQVFLGIYKQKLLFSMFLLFVSSWNNFIIPLNLISQTTQFTLPILIASLADPLNYFIGETFVALFFQTMPLILAYMYFSRSVEVNAYES